MEDLLASQECTLPTVERPFRIAEFETLFATSVQAVEHQPGSVRLRLSGEDGLEDRVRDLTARETSCCSFFDFTITARDHELLLEVAVPPAQRAILEGFARRAEELSLGA